MSLSTLPPELVSMILDFMACGRPYRIIEEVDRLEKILNLPSGFFTDHLPLEKLLMDQSNSTIQWRNVVTALDQLIPETPARYMVAGGFIAHQLGRTTRHGDVDIFISRPMLSTIPDVQGCQQHPAYGLGGFHRFFRVFDMVNSPFQFIVNYASNESIRDFAASILYDFDMQICQCAMLSNGKTAVVDTCMPMPPKHPNLNRIQKYRERLARHTHMCPIFCSQHWEFPY